MRPPRHPPDACARFLRFHDSPLASYPSPRSTKDKLRFWFSAPRGWKRRRKSLKFSSPETHFIETENRFPQKSTEFKFENSKRTFWRRKFQRFSSPFQNLRQKSDEENQIPQDDNKSIAKADQKSSCVPVLRSKKAVQWNRWGMLGEFEKKWEFKMMLGLSCMPKKKFTKWDLCSCPKLRTAR